MNVKSRLLYFRGAADHWREAARLQAKRCRNSPEEATQEARIEFNFYVVAAVRLREVARQLVCRERLVGLQSALRKFDARWPRLKELRHSEEHMRGMPAGGYPRGIWSFGEFAADAQGSGSIEYIFDARSAEADLDSLQSDILATVDAAMPMPEEDP